MNRNDFLQMIESSGPSDRATIGEVNELINIFPYFQSAYLLLLKGLQNTADVKFENQLRISAMHIADREVLYYLLKRTPEEKIKTEAPVHMPVLSVADTTENQQTVIESGRNSDDLISEIEREAERGNREVISGDRSVLISSETDVDESGATIFIIDGESGSVEEKITYMDPGFSIPESTDLLEIEAEGSEPSAVEPLIEPASERKLQSDLIDRFITANPRIETKKEKSDIPNVDISTPFIEEQGEFVTETLARIYIRQGYYSRAIDIYEKLSLKFPEKSSYFASQIEKVKELIKK
jgi:hypothetical protein